MQKSIWLGLAGLVMAAACAAPRPAALVMPAGALKLDASRSSLTAVAIKNEVKEVPVHFGGISGWASLDGHGDLQIPLTSLQTGDPARDQNVKSLFFEVEKAVSFAGARFQLSSVALDLAGLAEGKTLSAQALGSLNIHGASIPLSGPISFFKEGKAIRATLDAGWAIAIDKTTLVEPLKNLNAKCPQPHRVGNQVALQGTLVFIP